MYSSKNSEAWYREMRHWRVSQVTKRRLWNTEIQIPKLWTRQWCIDFKGNCLKSCGYWLCRFTFICVLILYKTRSSLRRIESSDKYELLYEIIAISTTFNCWIQGRRVAMCRREWKTKENKINRHETKKKKI